MSQSPPPQRQRRKRKLKSYPSSVLELTNLVLVSKTVGIDRNAIEDDVEFLLYQFITVK